MSPRVAATQRRTSCEMLDAHTTLGKKTKTS
jgi:hypothetical protein